MSIRHFVPCVSALALCVLLCTQPVLAQPLNDSCSMPVDLGSAASVATWDNSLATDDGPPLNVAAGAPCSTWSPSNNKVNGDLWYSWTPAAGVEAATFSLCYPIAPQVSNELLDNRVVIYDSTDCLTLSTMDIVACDDDGCVTPDNEIQAVVTTLVTPGTTYLIQVGSRSVVQSGVSTLTITPQAAPVTNLVCAVGPGADDYSLSFDYPPSATVGDTVEISSNETGGTNPIATLSFPANSFATSLLAQNQGNANVLDFTVQLISGAVTSPTLGCMLLLNQGAGDECATAGTIGTGTLDLVWNPGLATVSPDAVPSFCPSGGHFATTYGGDLWYRWFAPTERSRFIYTNNTGQPLFAVYNSCADAAAGVALDCEAFGAANEFTLDTTPGADYLIRIGDNGGAMQNGIMNIISQQGPAKNLTCTTIADQYTLTWVNPANGGPGDVLTLRSDEPGLPNPIIATVLWPGTTYTGTLLPANQGQSIGVQFEVVYGNATYGFAPAALCGTTFQPLPGDECTSATSIGTGNVVFNYNNGLAGTSPDPVPAACPSGAPVASDYNADLWFEWTATHPTTVVQVSAPGSDPVLAIYESCTQAGSGNAIDCENGGATESVSIPTNMGQTYFIRIGTELQSPGPGVLTINGYDLPANDDCASAQVLGGGNHTLAVSTLGATDSGTPPPVGPCPSTSFFLPDAFPQDLWYSWTATGGLAFISIEGVAGLTDPVLAIYDTCANANAGIALDCVDRGNPGSLQIQTMPGETFLIRFSHENGLAGTGELIIAEFGTPSNDECSTAVTLGVGDHALTFSTLGATASADPVPTGPCLSTTSIPSAFPADIWYSWQSSGGTGIFIVEGLSGINDPVVAVYESCANAALGIALDCADAFDPSVVRVPTTSGQTYLVRLSHESSAAGVGALVINEIQPPVNDECPSAINLGSGNQLLTVDLRGASGSFEPAPTPTSCASDQTTANNYAPDTWYQWIASTNSATFSFVRANVDPTTDPAFAIYRDCFDAGAGVFIDCQDSGVTTNEITIAVTPGNSYIIRVGDDSGTTGGVGTLMISEFQSVTNLLCTNTTPTSDFQISWTNPQNGGAGDMIQIVSTEPGVLNPAFLIPWPGTATLITSLLPANQGSPSLNVTYTATYIGSGGPAPFGESCSILFHPAPGELCSVATALGAGDMVVNYDNSTAVSGPDPVPGVCASGGSNSAYNEDLWYTWTATDLLTEFDATVAAGDPLLAIYSNCTDAASGIAIDCANRGLSTNLTIPTIPGNDYRIRVASGFQNPGPGVLTITAIQPPVGQLTCAPVTGDSVTLQWTNPPSGATGDMIIVTTDEPGVLNPVATLAWPMDSLPYTLSGINQGTTQAVTFSLTYLGALGTASTETCTAIFNPIANDDCATALTLTGALPVIATVNLLGANPSASPSPPCNLNSDFNEDAWFQWTATLPDADISFRSATMSDPVIAVYESCVNAAGAMAIACDDGPIGSATVQPTLIPGVTYLIRVANDDSNSLGEGELTIDGQCADLTDFAADFQCVSQVVALSWTEEASYVSLSLTANGVPTTNQPTPLGVGLSNGQVELSPPLDAIVTYELTATCANGGSSTLSVTVSTATTGADNLIIALEEPSLVDSAAAIDAALLANGRPTITVYSQQQACLAQLIANSCAVWVVEGTFPDQVLMSPALGDLLHSAVQAGKLVYLEGGDHWFSATPSNFDLVDGVSSAAVLDGDDFLTSVQGIDAPMVGLNLPATFPGPVVYTQDQVGNDSIDELTVATPAEDTDITSAEVMLRNSPDNTPVVGTEPDFACAVVTLTNSGISTISSSVEFGGLGDAFTQVELMAELLTLVGIDGLLEFQRGDCNNDSAKNIADPVRLLNFLFPPVTPPVPLDCDSACDANDDGSLNIADAVAMLNVLFPTGPPIAWLAPDQCGVDPTTDTLTCAAYSNCP